MRIFLVDRQPLFREGLKTIMSGLRDLTIVGEADRCVNLGPEARKFELLILDGELESFAMLDAIGKTRTRGRPPFTLVIAENSDHHAAQMLRAGADGYIDKASNGETILTAIRTVGRGGKYVSTTLAERLLFPINGLSRPSSLSQREYQVLYMMASGLTAKEISYRLSLSVKTVSTYRGRLLEKLNLTNNAALIRYAVKEGIAV